MFDINVSPEEPKIEVKLRINDACEKIKELKNLEDRPDTGKLIEIIIRDSNEKEICTLQFVFVPHAFSTKRKKRELLGFSEQHQA